MNFPQRFRSFSESSCSESSCSESSCSESSCESSAHRLAGFDQHEARERNLLIALIGVGRLDRQESHLAAAAALLFVEVGDPRDAGQRVAHEDRLEELELL